MKNKFGSFKLSANHTKGICRVSSDLPQCQQAMLICQWEIAHLSGMPSQFNHIPSLQLSLLLTATAPHSLQPFISLRRVKKENIFQYVVMLKGALHLRGLPGWSCQHGGGVEGRISILMLLHGSGAPIWWLNPLVGSERTGINMDEYRESGSELVQTRGTLLA